MWPIEGVWVRIPPRSSRPLTRSVRAGAPRAGRRLRLAPPDARRLWPQAPRLRRSCSDPACGARPGTGARRSQAHAGRSAWKARLWRACAVAASIEDAAVSWPAQARSRSMSRAPAVLSLCLHAPPAPRVREPWRSEPAGCRLPRDGPQFRLGGHAHSASAGVQTRRGTGRPGWYRGAISPSEMFAEAYALCARFGVRRPAARKLGFTGSVYGYRPSRRQHRVVCRLILRVGTPFRGGPVGGPPPGAPPVTEQVAPPTGNAPAPGGQTQPQPAPQPLLPGLPPLPLPLG